MIYDRPMLSLDLGTHLGWAAWRPTSWLGHGRVILTGEHAPRFAQARREIAALIAAHGPRLLVIETPSARHRGAALVLYGLRAIALLVAHEHGMDVLEVMPAELKQQATGKGNADKAAVLAAARARWGDVETEDEADALWALEWARINAEIERT